MPGLSFPDVNVWMAALLPEHIHHELAKSWWESDEFDSFVLPVLRRSVFYGC